jgi:chromosome segregation ATPase
LTAQRRQLEQAEKDSLAGGAAAYKTAMLTLTDKRIEELQISIERNDKKISSLLSAAATNSSWVSDAKKAMIEAEQANKGLEAKVRALREGIYSFLLKQHQSIAEMEHDFAEWIMPMIAEERDESGSSPSAQPSLE